MDDRMLDIDLIRELQKDNIWWENKHIPEAYDKPFHRADFFKYLEYLDSKDIQVIIGPRRVGKTILFHQIIRYLINKMNVDPKQILYLDLGKPYISFNIGGIVPCLNVYQEAILKKDFSKLKKEERVYVFIDEVQKEENWATSIEGYRSRNYPLSFFVTGSSSTELEKTASESLVGRLKIKYILPLKFSDIVRIQKGYDRGGLKEVKQLRSKFSESVTKKNISIFYDYIIKELVTSTLNKDFEIEVKTALDVYLLRGGYPEFYDEYKNAHWYSMAKRMRDDYFQRIISRDIVETYKVQKPEILRKIYMLIAFDTGNLGNFQNYSDILHSRPNTVLDYFEYLQSSFLVSYSEKFYGSKKRPKGEQKKIYVSDIGMRNAVLGINEKDFGKPSADLGLMIETVVHNHCKRLKYRLHPTNNYDMEYWRDSEGKELDLVLDLGNLIIPIEVKYKEKFRTDYLKILNKFIDANKGKCKFGILVSKRELKMESNILVIPVWLFLLII